MFLPLQRLRTTSLRPRLGLTRTFSRGTGGLFSPSELFSVERRLVSVERTVGRSRIARGSRFAKAKEPWQLASFGELFFHWRGGSCPSNGRLCRWHDLLACAAGGKVGGCSELRRPQPPSFQPPPWPRLGSTRTVFRGTGCFVRRTDCSVVGTTCFACPAWGKLGGGFVASD